mmetsp:Transcript_22605/g.32827  ORF Transcript_22605/g.32827 Transcript_22605/m.32827 type:complete len:83 (+) Transcript_22605:44-292(+)
MNPNSSCETILSHDSIFQNDLKICTNHEGQKMKTANSLAIFLLHLSHLINYCALVVCIIDQLYSVIALLLIRLSTGCCAYRA